MISTENKMISDAFAKLRNDTNCFVYNFNTQTRMKYGATKKLCDIIVIGKSGIRFVEIKLKSTKDRERGGQKAFAKLVTWLSSRTDLINYYRVTSFSEGMILTEFITEEERKAPICDE